jgi:hypothetical protein
MIFRSSGLFVGADEYTVRYSRNQIAKALLAANRLLKGPVCPAARVAEVLSPYMDCTEVREANGQLHEGARSSIFATMGDAYRRDGNVQLAAQWYRRASVISPGDHVPIYAYMVCKHQLADFYSDALATLEEHQRRWLTKPVLVRLFRWIALRTWADTERREMARNGKSALDFLRQHALAKAA